MTNAELAKHFAGLPPDEPGKVFLVNGDTRTMSEEPLVVTTKSDLEEIDDADEDAVGHPHIYLRW